jgi:hypothetical protein
MADLFRGDRSPRSAAAAERDLLLGFARRVRAIADDADQASVEIRHEVERQSGNPSAGIAPDELGRAFAELADTVARRLTTLGDECDQLSITLERSARAIGESPPGGPANRPTDEAGSHSRSG